MRLVIYTLHARIYDSLLQCHAHLFSLGREFPICSCVRDNKGGAGWGCGGVKGDDCPKISFNKHKNREMIFLDH